MELTDAFMRVSGAMDFVFFDLIMQSLDKRIEEFRVGLFDRVVKWVAEFAWGVLTLWVAMKGGLIVSGRSRDSIAAFFMNVVRAMFIVLLATAVSITNWKLTDLSAELRTILFQDLQHEISRVVTGSSAPAEKQIDKALGWMQVAMASIDAIEVANDPEMGSEKLQAKFFIGLGTGGPAVVAGSMLMLYKIALALFVGLAPLFILCLLFEQTKPLFQKWLLYGLGTMFSMAVLAVMVDYAMTTVVAVAESFWARAAIDMFLLGGGGGTSLSSMALQQGGLGVIMTTLIVTAPPMAAMFFQGVLGNFSPFSQISGGTSAAQTREQAAPSAPTAVEAQQQPVPQVHPHLVPGAAHPVGGSSPGIGPGLRGNAGPTLG
ncbi:type IV secretion system protein [Stenotrophomonas oahuensis]|uniref:Type IV secretion system protein n=1 Tax=Stenotrophomonas oahuensis TaxID=3003271 RepID=A0ABY9YNQ0_9GAMM|nr:type IV secretion system protein [Stenotrophomonas sp. A5586]WNH52491.1 type IV secretion system protein [Stenotrophomonas sp. A5586]